MKASRNLSYHGGTRWTQSGIRVDFISKKGFPESQEFAVEDGCARGGGMDDDGRTDPCTLAAEI